MRGQLSFEAILLMSASTAALALIAALSYHAGQRISSMASEAYAADLAGLVEMNGAYYLSEFQAYVPASICRNGTPSLSGVSLPVSFDRRMCASPDRMERLRMVRLGNWSYEVSLVG